MKPLKLTIVSLLASTLFILGGGFPHMVHAEWFIAAYGGLSSIGNFENVELPILGESIADADADLFNPNDGSNFRRTVNLKAEDIQLEDSLMFGARAGHFFNEFGFPWFGIEIEAFSLEPNAKDQPLDLTLEATRFNPSVLNPPPGGADPVGGADVPFTKFPQQNLSKSSLRVTTLAINILARYPGEIFQPYIGAGLGGFWFKGEGELEGSRIVPGLNALAGLKVQLTEHWGIFGEAKYNRATVEGLGPTLGLQGDFSIFHWLGGITFTFESL